MANEVLVKHGTPTVWANSGDYSSVGSNYTRTHQINLTSVANNAAREGEKADLGATRAASYTCRVGFELDVAPTAGSEIDVFWSASRYVAAISGNDGGGSGVDGAYRAGEEAEWSRQLLYVGSLVVTADAAPIVQRQTINTQFMPPTRYGFPIVYNRAGQAFEGDAVEMYVALDPNIDEIQ